MSNTLTRYYVTNNGLAAALSHPDVLKTIQGILAGRAHPMTLKSFHTRGLIEIDKRRGTRADHNTLILSGAVERVREVLMSSAPPPPVATAADNGKRPKTPVTYALNPAPEPQFSPTVEKVRGVLAAFNGECSFEQIAGHATLKGMNAGTLRWAIQVLRRAGLCQSNHKGAEAAA